MRKAYWDLNLIKSISILITVTALHCEPGVLVRAKIREIPAGTTSLSVKSYLNHDPYMVGSQDIPYTPEVFQIDDQATELTVGLQLPTTTAGSLRVDVIPMDSSGVAVKDPSCNVEYFASAAIPLIGTEITADVDIDPKYSSSLTLPVSLFSMDSLNGLAIESQNSVYVGDNYGNILHWSGCGWQGPDHPDSTATFAMAVAPTGEIWDVGGCQNGVCQLKILFKPSGLAWTHTSTQPGPTGILNLVRPFAQNNVIAAGNLTSNGQTLPIAWIQWDGTQWNQIPYPNTGSNPNYASSTNAFEQLQPSSTKYISAGQLLSSVDTAKNGYVRGNIVLIDTAAANPFTYPWNQAPVKVSSMAVTSDPRVIWFGGQDYLAYWDQSMTLMPAFGSDSVLANVTVVGGIPSGAEVVSIWVPPSSPNIAYALLVSGSSRTDLVQVSAGAVTSLLPAPFTTAMHSLSGIDLGNGDVDLWLAGEEGKRFRYTRTAGRVQSTLFVLSN